MLVLVLVVLCGLSLKRGFSESEQQAMQRFIGQTKGEIKGA